MYEEELTLILLKLLHTTAEEENLSFYEATITLILKPDKDNKQKRNYRPISLINTNANLQQNMENLNSAHIKRIIYHDQVGLSPGCKDFSVSTSQSV